MQKKGAQDEQENVEQNIQIFKNDESRQAVDGDSSGKGKQALQHLRGVPAAEWRKGRGRKEAKKAGKRRGTTKQAAAGARRATTTTPK